MNKIRFRLTAYTDPAGKWNDLAPKKGNEDDLFVDADLANGVQGEFVSDKVIDLSDAGCLMVVADGMGGMNAGEVASSIAIDTVKASFSAHNLSHDVIESSIARVKFMERVVVEADAAIKGRSRIDKECEGMGSTIILAWLCGNELSVTWCGDSRAYIYRDAEGIRQVSKDHSYVQSLIDQGSLTEAAAFDHPYSNIITRSLGDPDKKAVPDSVTVPIYKGDIVLLCSDGLNGVLRDRETFDEEGNVYPGENIENIIRNNRETMTGCREALWVAAECADWYDNVTAILCEIIDGDEYVAAPNSGTMNNASSHSVAGTKSFIKIRKSTLRKFVIAVPILVLCLGLFLFFLKRNGKNKEYDTRWTELYNEARQGGYASVERQLIAIQDSSNVDLLDEIARYLKLRYELVDTLKARVDKSDYPDLFLECLEYIKTSDTVSITSIPDKREKSTIKSSVKKTDKVIKDVKAEDDQKAEEDKGIEKLKDIIEKGNDDKPNLTEVISDDHVLTEVKFKILSHIAEPKVGLDSISRKYCNGIYPKLALIEKQSYILVESGSIQKDKEYYVVLFDANDFDGLCQAIKACNGRLNNGLTPEGFNYANFYKDGKIEWNCLPENEDYTIVLK